MFLRRELALSNYDVNSVKAKACHEEKFFKIERKKFNIEEKISESKKILKN